MTRPRLAFERGEGGAFPSALQIDDKSEDVADGARHSRIKVRVESLDAERSVMMLMGHYLRVSRARIPPRANRVIS